MIRKGKLEFIEKNKLDKKVVILELTEEVERQFEIYVHEIEKLIESEQVPDVLNQVRCKKCAYYEYCYI